MQCASHAEDAFDYLVFSETGESTFAYEIHEADTFGDDQLVVTWSGSGTSMVPRSFVVVGSDHWVVIGWSETMGENVPTLIDIDHGIVTTSEPVKPPGVGATNMVLLSAGDAAGNLYGITIVDGQWAANNVVRARRIRARPDRWGREQTWICR